MPVTQADIDALNLMIRDGVRSVTIGPSTTTYNTTASLMKARDDLVAQYNAEQSVALSKRHRLQTRLFYAGRGY